MNPRVHAANIKKARERFVAGTTFLALVSGLTTFNGLYRSMSEDYLIFQILGAAILAIASFVIIRMAWPTFYEQYPVVEEPAKRRKMLRGIVVLVVCTLLVSTLLSAAGIGGSTSVQLDMRQKSSLAMVTLQRVHRRRKQEKDLVPTLRFFSAQFSGLSLNARRGRFTGVRGRGAISRQLDDLSGTLKKLASEIESRAAKLDRSYDKASRAAEEMGEVVISNLPQKEKVTRFQRRASDYNKHLNDLLTASFLSAVVQITRNLDAFIVSTLPSKNKKIAKRQLAVRKLLQETIGNARMIIGRQFEELKAERITSPNLTVLSPIQGIFRYFHWLIPFWGIALGVDLFPVLALIVLCNIQKKSATAAFRSITDASQPQARRPRFEVVKAPVPNDANGQKRKQPGGNGTSPTPPSVTGRTDVHRSAT